MKKLRFKKIGPISYYRVNKGRKSFISAWLTSNSDASYGWEWGTDETESNPSVCLRIGHFNIFSYESFAVGGFIVWFLGFWYMQ